MHKQERSSQPAKDSKRQVIMLSVPQVSLTPRLKLLAKVWVLLRILSQEHKRSFTSYLYANREQGCLSHWRACPIPFSAPWNLLWEPALLISALHCNCGLKLQCQQGKQKETFFQLGNNLVAEQTQAASGTFISTMLQAWTSTAQFMGCDKPGLNNRSSEEKMDGTASLNTIYCGWSSWYLMSFSACQSGQSQPVIWMCSSGTLNNHSLQVLLLQGFLTSSMGNNSQALPKWDTLRSMTDPENQALLCKIPEKIYEAEDLGATSQLRSWAVFVRWAHLNG